MDGFLEFLSNYYIVDIMIGVIGLIAMALVAERFKALYIDYVIDADAFTKQIVSFVNEDKIEEAVTFCAANEKKPLAHVMKRLLEKSDRDEKAMNQALDIASSEVGPKLVKSLGHLAMIANVVTLVGLLGTVAGLIVAFRAVSFADVSQKQTLLAQGISMAMTATALGLLIAIPVMFVYSFLHAKQSSMFTDIDRSTHLVMEALENRMYTPTNGLTAYPADLNKDVIKTPAKPAPPKTKVS